MSTPHLEAIALLGKLRADLTRELDRVADILTAGRAGEDPIPIKVAAYRFGTSEKTMQRLAKSGAGVLLRNRWHIYPSLVILPVVNA